MAQCPSRQGNATINKQQQVKQGIRGKMSRGLNDHSPLACSSINECIRLVLHQKLLLGVQIVKLWMAQDASTVLQSSSHDPIVIHQHINVSPLTRELHCLIMLSSDEYWIRHPGTNSDTNTGEINQSPQARPVHNQAGL
jgi:hypothetical protein